jgi:hypothetical protein
MYRCPLDSRDFPQPICPDHGVFGTAEVPRQFFGSDRVKCQCGCGQLHPFDPTREGKEYINDEDWVKMLDRHARNFIDMPIQTNYEKGEFVGVEKPSIKAGIFVKMGPGLMGLNYLNRLMKSVMVSDVQQPMVVWIHGWGVGDSSDQTHMSDIYMGRDQGVPMLAQHVEKDGIVAMIDNDIVLPPKWYSHVREVFEKHPEIGALYPMVQLESDTAIQLVQVPSRCSGHPTGGIGSNDIHHYNPNLGSYIHKGTGQIVLTDAKIMGTIAWRCTDMAVFYRADMVREGLNYTHDWYRWKIKSSGYFPALDKDFVVAHYKEFGERNYGNPNLMVPFYVCVKCNHVCDWGTVGLSPTLRYICPTCEEEVTKVE